MRILLVEDDALLAKELARVLREENFAVDTADDGLAASDLGASERYDAAILDLGLPHWDGVKVLEYWRECGCNFPVMILTSRDTWAQKLAGFRAGADDYITKPFLQEEVIARLRALMRRAAGMAIARIRCGDLVYDTMLGSFERNGEQLRLTAFEWRILSALMQRKEVVVDKSELLEQVYEYDRGGGSNSIEVIVGRLRRKLGTARIETVRGRGYRLTAQDIGAGQA